MRTDRPYLLAQERRKENELEKRKTFTSIKKVSDKQKALLVEYAKLRKNFLKVHVNCEAQLIGCTKDATEVHHRAGRGAFLLDVITWLSICRSCHNQIHNAMGILDATDQGLRIRRNANPENNTESS